MVLAPNMRPPGQAMEAGVEEKPQLAQGPQQGPHLHVTAVALVGDLDDLSVAPDLGDHPQDPVLGRRFPIEAVVPTGCSTSPPHGG